MHLSAVADGRQNGSASGKQQLTSERLFVSITEVGPSEPAASGGFVLFS